MIVLGLDTTGADCSVSLVDDAVVRAHISRNIGRGHAEVLASMVQEAFDVAKLHSTDVDRLAVCTGPGSFTGLRGMKPEAISTPTHAVTNPLCSSLSSCLVLSCC